MNKKEKKVINDKNKKDNKEIKIDNEIYQKDRNDLLEMFIKSKKNDSIKEIFTDLMNANDNLELKTHINNPKEIAVLKTESNYLESISFSHSAFIIDSFIEFFSKYMISFKRLGRTELLKAVSYYGQFIENPEQDFSNLNKSVWKKLNTKLK